MSHHICSNTTLQFSSSSYSSDNGEEMIIDYKPFDTSNCTCFFCQIGMIHRIEIESSSASTSKNNEPKKMKKKNTTKSQSKNDITKLVKNRKLGRKYFTSSDDTFSRDDIEYQLNIANYEARVAKREQQQISGHLGSYGEYFYTYEWSLTTYDNLFTLNLIELCCLTQTPDFREFRKKQQQLQGNYSRYPELDSPIPILIAFEKMASNHGRRLRLVDITDKSIFDFFVKHRHYSVQSDDSNCLIDK